MPDTTARPSSFAVLADVHGNVWALREVLADIRSRGIRSVFNLGDSVYGVLAPAATADLLMGGGIRSLCGNQDRNVVSPTEESAASADHRHVFAELRREHLAWFAAQPKRLAERGVLFCHGTPDSDETYLLETVTVAGARPASEGEIVARLGSTEERLVACAHSHVPRVVRLADGRTVLNPGSVGMPAYTEDLPVPHAMESGSPHARYAIVTPSCGDWNIELVALRYPWSDAAAVARRDGRDDRARWIETGRASLGGAECPCPA